MKEMRNSGKECLGKRKQKYKLKNRRNNKAKKEDF
jgi:hypothetical protein